MRAFVVFCVVVAYVAAAGVTPTSSISVTPSISSTTTATQSVSVTPTVTASQGLTATASPSQSPACGNGVLDSTLGEVCDIGNTNGNQGCSSDCTSFQTGFTCSNTGTGTQASPITLCAQNSGTVIMTVKFGGSFTLTTTMTNLAAVLGISTTRFGTTSATVTTGARDVSSVLTGARAAQAGCIGTYQNQEAVTFSINGDPTTSNSGWSQVNFLAGLVQSGDSRVQQNGLCISSLTYSSATVANSQATTSRTYAKDVGIGVGLGIGLPICCGLLIALACAASRRGAAGPRRKAPAAAPAPVAPQNAAPGYAPGSSSSDDDDYSDDY